ncbi:MAG: ArsR/SmtB family transcription factor, partial [Acidimicrobiia bacterium]
SSSPRHRSRPGRRSKATKKAVPRRSVEPEVESAQLFRLLGDPGRLRILLELRGRELPVFDLAIVAEMSPSGASHALGLLRANCAVKVRKVGKYSYYSLKDVRTDRLLDLIFK